MKKPYKILHLEDVQTDSEQVAFELKKNNIYFEILVIDSLVAYEDALDNFKPAIILCSHSMPALNSIKALEVLKEKKLEIPFILITSILNEEIVMSVIKKGADDYIIKDRLMRLPFALVNSIEKATHKKDRKKMDVAAFEKEVSIKKDLKMLSEKLKLASKIVGLGVWEYNVADGIFTADDTILQLNGVTRNAFNGSQLFFIKMVHPDDLETFKKEVAEGAAKEIYIITFRIILPDKSIRWLKSVIKHQRNKGGQIDRIIGTSQDVTEHKLRELAIKESDEKYRSFFENSMDGIVLTIPNGTVVAANPAAQVIFKMSEKEFCNCTRYDLFDYHDQRLQPFLDERNKNGRATGEFRLLRHDGTSFEAGVSSAIFSDANDYQQSSLIIRDISTRIQAQQLILQTSTALQNALEDVKKILSSSLDIICTLNDSGNFVTISSACKQIWQYSPLELVEKNYLNFVHPDDVEKTIQMKDSVKNGNPVTIFQNRVIRKDGEEVPMLWSARWDQSAELMYCIAKDATDKVRFEKAFEYERQRFKEMFHQAPSSIAALKGKDYRFELANNNYLQLIGKTNIIGKTLKEVLPEVEAQGFIKILDAVFETGNVYQANEMHIQLANGGNDLLSDLYLNFIFQPYRNQNCDVEGIFIFANDVSERVMARRKALTETANLQSILNNTDISYILLDKHIKIVAFNRKANENMLAVYGTNLENGQYYPDRLDNETKQEAKGSIQKVFAGQIISSEVYFPSINGQPRWYLYKMNPISIENNVSGVCISAEDITTKKEAEIEREQITSDLLQRNNDLEQFNYIVSHNLRAPVANISGAVSILNNKDLDSQTKELFWNAVSISVNRLDNVIQDLNTILEIKTKQHQQKEYVQFIKLTQNIKDSIAKSLDEAGFTILTSFDEIEGIDTVKGYLYSIFYNLIINSLKYRRHNIAPVLSITSRKIGNSVQIIFSDNGLGFNAEKKKDQVFKLYKRFHNNIEGKGIGLFIVKTQVETLGGHIEVISREQEGTTFTITI